MKTPTAIIHVPHSSTAIPFDVREQYALTSAELERELLRMTDRYTDELFALPAGRATAIVYPVSRLVVDPERFEDDSREPMAAKGMGIIYTRTSDGRSLRRPVGPEERAALIAAYYRPHHERFSRAVEEALSAHGYCLIIDAHSFSSRPLPYEPDQRTDRPAICVGTDDFHTPVWLTEHAVAHFRAHFDSVEINRPYAGAMVPGPYFQKERRVHSIMIEVNRSLYMDEGTGLKLPACSETAAALQEAAASLVEAAQERLG